MVNTTFHLKFVLPKKVTDLQRKEILNAFKNGLDLKVISKSFNFSLVTIVRQLKNMLGEEIFNEIKDKNKNILLEPTNLNHEKKFDFDTEKENFKEQFVEVIPMIEGVELEKQKEFASEPLEEANLPDVVYMLIDKNIELIPKMLKEYPEWSFMPKEDLKRFTLQIFDDHKFAKKICTKNQKLIKVPNSKVFFLASNLLKSKGITRIIFNNLLLAL
tara:strand:- start:2236 stop:2883 length:648 start_codon:yes stop_codon:yes gene_type:complete